PNQEWIWAPGGFGVFDPGINALSIATHILPPMFITSAVLDFPENRASPVAAHVIFRTSNGLPVTMELDWLQTGPQSWDILAETDKGKMVLSGGGAKLAVDGKIIQGTSDLDCSLASGESTPKNVAPGEAVQAGVLNLTGPLTIQATAAAKDSFLAEMVRLMESAEGG
ncbi:hypothetical protein EOD23_37600, partial [Mesorhizobium sp. USDA-HM6]